MRHEVRLPATFKHAHDLRPGELRWWESSDRRLAAAIQLEAVAGDEIEVRLELRGTGHQVYAALAVERVGARERGGAREYELRVERITEHEVALLQAWMDEWAPARIGGELPSSAPLPADPRTFPRVADAATFGRPTGEPRHAPRPLVEGHTAPRPVDGPGRFPGVRVGATPRGWMPPDAVDVAVPSFLRAVSDPPSHPRMPGDPPSRVRMASSAGDPPTRAVAAAGPRAFPPARGPDPVSRPVVPPRASDPPSRGFPPPRPPAAHATDNPWHRPVTPAPPPPGRAAAREVTASWAIGRFAVRWSSPAALLDDWERHLQHHAFAVRLAEVAAASPADQPSYGDRVDVAFTLPDGEEVRAEGLVAGVCGGEVVLRLALPVDALGALDRGAAAARRRSA